MKLSVSAWSVQENLFSEKMSLVDFIDLCVENNVASVELLDCFWKSDTHHEEIKSYLEKVNMEVSAYSIANDFVQNKEERESEIEKVKKGIDMAVFLGTKLLRVFSGDVKDDIPFEKGKEWIVESFKECAVYAKEKNITMVLENHGKFAGKSEQVKEIIASVNCSSLKANTDTGNFLLVCENPLDAVKSLKDQIAFVHFKDFTKADFEVGYMADDGTWFEGTAIGEGDVPLVEIVQFLRDVRYEGYLSIEFEGTGDPIEGTIKSIAFCKDLLLKINSL